VSSCTSVGASIVFGTPMSWNRTDTVVCWRIVTGRCASGPPGSGVEISITS
jgi:hypothetical protein